MAAKQPISFHRSRSPLYLQVASIMRHRIESGAWKGGERISTIETLETEFGVARVTIRQALEILSEEGLLQVRQGRGTFVADQLRDRHWFNLAHDLEALSASIKDHVLRVVEIDEHATPPILAVAEGTLADAYVRLRSVQHREEEPFAVANVFLALSLFARDRKYFTRHPALPRILDYKDVKIARAPQTVTIGVPGPEVCALLDIGLGEPTADCRLVLVDDGGTAIYAADFHYRRDAFSLRRDLLEGAKSRARPAPRRRAVPG